MTLWSSVRAAVIGKLDIFSNLFCFMFQYLYDFLDSSMSSSVDVLHHLDGFHFKFSDFYSCFTSFLLVSCKENEYFKSALTIQL